MTPTQTKSRSIAALCKRNDFIQSISFYYGLCKKYCKYLSDLFFKFLYFNRRWYMLVRYVLPQTHLYKQLVYKPLFWNMNSFVWAVLAVMGEKINRVFFSNFQWAKKNSKLARSQKLHYISFCIPTYFFFLFLKLFGGSKQAATHVFILSVIQKGALWDQLYIELGVKQMMCRKKTSLLFTSQNGLMIKFSFSEKDTKICAIFLWVLPFIQ